MTRLGVDIQALYAELAQIVMAADAFGEHFLAPPRDSPGGRSNRRGDHLARACPRPTGRRASQGGSRTAAGIRPSGGDSG